MRPVRTTASNARLPGAKTGADAWVQRTKVLLPGALGIPTPIPVAYVVFEPTPAEREAHDEAQVWAGILNAAESVTDLGGVDPFARHEAQARLRKSVATFFRVYDGPHEGAWGDAVNEAVAEMRGALDAERSNEIAVGNATVLTVGRRVVVDGTVFEVRPGPTLAPVGEVFDMVDDEGDDGD